jgi:hypothetical protein
MVELEQQAGMLGIKPVAAGREPLRERRSGTRQQIAAAGEP